jgi:hypothetical protein
LLTGQVVLAYGGSDDDGRFARALRNRLDAARSTRPTEPSTVRPMSEGRAHSGA